MSREEANRIARAVERARRSRRAALKVAIPTVAALGAGAAIAIGSIPSNDGTITGCYVTSPTGTQRYGDLRVIDPSAADPSGRPTPTNSCESDEATIAWNQHGPQGPQGVQGPAGAPGAAGRDLIGTTSFSLGGGGRTFLKLDGIDGESTDKQHKGEIEISSFSIGTSAPRSTGSGAGAGKVSFSSFTITKSIDKASPQLFKAAATGKHFNKATVEFVRKAGRGQQEYLEYKLTNVLVSSIQDGTSGGGRPTEQISFNFAKIEEVFLGSNGKPVQQVSINLQNKLN